VYVDPVDPEALSPGLRAQWEQASDGGKRFVQAMANAPTHAERLFPYYNGIRFGTRLGPRLSELLRLAIARTTQCPTCLAGRLPAAFEEGLTEEHIDDVVSARLDRLPSREAAMVSFADKFGSDHFAIGPDDLAALYAHFDQEEVVEIGMLCAQFLGFGRLAMVLGLEDPVCAIPVHAEPASREPVRPGG
jgi:AhpD family alkylhydroperoxidase